MRTDERKLIAAFQAGDPTAFNTLYQRYSGRVLAFARQLTGSRTDAEDLTQEVFLGAYRAATGFRGQSRLLTWLFSIAVRRHRDNQRRHELRTVSLFDNDLEEGEEGAYPVAYEMTRQVLDAVQLQEALERLSPGLREAFVLVAVQELTHKEAAAVLEIPIGTVKWQVAEAGRRLRVLLQETEERAKEDVFPIHCG